MSFSIIHCLFLVITSCILFWSSTRASGAHYDEMSDSGTVPGGSAGSWDILNGRLGRPTCVEIPANLTLCRGLEYNQMRLPNLLEHDSLREVTQQSSSWKPLLGLRCHADTQLFLCSLFAPVCLDRLEAAVWPCRSLCRAVQAGCEGPMLRYGFPWPEMLRCDKFPLDNDLCIGVITNQDDSVCEACTQAYTFEGIGDNYCSADFVMKVRIRSTQQIDSGDLQLTLKRKRKIYKVENIRRKVIRDAVLQLDYGSRCNCTHLIPEVVRTQFYLVMGNIRNGKLSVTFLHPYERSRGLRDAMKAMKAGSICEGGVQVLTVSNLEGKGETDMTSSQGKNTNEVSSLVNGEVAHQRTPARARAEGSRRNRNQDRMSTDDTGNRVNRHRYTEHRASNRNHPKRGNRRGEGSLNNRREEGSSGRRKNRVHQRNN